jgi:fucose 4-O-acetylase-like acetyltransferase
MPGFLIISGYLMNITKPCKDFIKTILGYAIPYLMMESGYIVMASALPIREHIDNLTFSIFLDMLFLHSCIQ